MRSKVTLSAMAAACVVVAMAGPANAAGAATVEPVAASEAAVPAQPGTDPASQTEPAKDTPSTPDPTPTPDPAPTPDPTPQPDPAPEPDSMPTPDPTPEPAPPADQGTAATTPDGSDAGTGTDPAPVAPDPQQPATPNVAAIAPVNHASTVGTSDSYDLATLCPSGDACGNWVITSALPDGLSFSGTTVSGTPTTAGTFVVSYSVDVTVGGVTTQETGTINWAVNDVITFPNPGDQESFVGDQVSLVLAATTADKTNTVTYSVDPADLPDGISFDPATGTFSGTAESAGWWTITVTASADYAVDESITFDWFVDGPDSIALDPIPDQRNTVGDKVLVPVSISVETSQNSFDADLGDYAADLYAEGVPPGVDFDSDTGAFTGTVTTAGTYSVSVEVCLSWDDSVCDDASFTWTVEPAAAPKIAPLPPKAMPMTPEPKVQTVTYLADTGASGNSAGILFYALAFVAAGGALVLVRRRFATR